MSDHVPPALTQEEWAEIQAMHDPLSHDTLFEGVVDPVGQLPYMMAVANYALPEDDPHKITRADVLKLRDWRYGCIAQDHAEWTDSLLRRIAALLPPG